MSMRKTSGSAVGSQPAPSDLWSYAVPPDEEPIEQAFPAATTKQSFYASRPRQPLSTNVNSNARPKTRSKNKSMQGLDTSYNAGSNLRPPPARDHGEGSDTGSGTDSLLDLYRPSKESLRGTSRDRQRVRRKGSQGAVAALKDPSATEDPDKWIHRDKLQQIEIQEMMAEGRRLDFPSRRGTSQMGSVVDESEFREDEGAYSHDQKRQRMVSPTLSSRDLQEDQETFNDTTNGADVANRAFHPRRPSTSRIPIKGVNSNETTSPTLTNPGTRIGARVRSTSQSSTNILDTTTPKSFSKIVGGYSTPTTSSPIDSSPQASPPKPRTNTRNSSSLRGRGQAPTRGGARSASANTAARPRTASSAANSPQSRPGTSGARPTTSKPEGEPPWLATMYKPDPRLPPDQQMLPTHAKRLAGMTPEQRAGGHDDLTLLNDEEDEEAQRREARNEYLDSLGAQTQSTPHGSVRGSPQKQQKHTLSPDAQSSSRSQKRASWNSSTGRRSPNTLAPDQGQNPNNSQWPLRSLSINKYAPQSTEPIYIDEFGMQHQQQQQQGQQPEHQQPSPQHPSRSPKSDTASLRKPPSDSSTGAGYSLMPPATEQRGSARLSPVPGTLYPPPRPSHQVTRVPGVDEKADEEGGGRKKKGGCGGCCVVM